MSSFKYGEKLVCCCCANCLNGSDKTDEKVRCSITAISHFEEFECSNYIFSPQKFGDI